MPPSADWRMPRPRPGPNPRSRGFPGRIATHAAEVEVIVAAQVVEPPKPRGWPKPWPHMAAWKSSCRLPRGPAQPETSQGRALHAPQSAIGMAAVPVMGCQPRPGPTLGHVLGPVGAVALAIQEHRDAQHRAALNARMGAAEDIVARQVEDHQHGAIEIAAPLEVLIVAAQIDHRARRRRACPARRCSCRARPRGSCRPR